MRRENPEAESMPGWDSDHEAAADSQTTVTVMQQGQPQPAGDAMVGTQASQAFPPTPPAPALPAPEPAAPTDAAVKEKELSKPKQKRGRPPSSNILEVRRTHSNHPAETE